MSPMFPLSPPQLNSQPAARSFYADVVYERIQQSIKEVTDKLEEGEQISVFVCLEGGGRVVVESFGFFKPVLLV